MLQIIDSTQRLDSNFLQALQVRLQAVLEQVATSLANGTRTLLHRDIELLLCSKEYMHSLNVEFMGKDYATDVLSFPLAPLDLARDSSELELMTEVPLGSIAINIPLAQMISEQYSHSLYDELCLLFLHGLLHLLGFDHERDSGEHRALESRLITSLSLPNGLIDRTLLS
ncbi:rRNA maturation RNase YbeY [Helicobacter sp.]|uniref:rRNA maturation RNase YbeY n=1 Tax=Helicobacter sp. TaxID=218 RepID=UPI0025C41449|nr:rRNA maturation RNase YbeY [Helicobacter sp.]MBR2494155.1 rRNA maturation RNase YbeY [Helicobacter sp.]